jgi:hypothetical protein
METGVAKVCHSFYGTSACCEWAGGSGELAVVVICPKSKRDGPEVANTNRRAQ